LKEFGISPFWALIGLFLIIFSFALIAYKCKKHKNQTKKVEESEENYEKTQVDEFGTPEEINLTKIDVGIGRSAGAARADKSATFKTARKKTNSKMDEESINFDSDREKHDENDKPIYV
jgi:hypothetical protein